MTSDWLVFVFTISCVALNELFPKSICCCKPDLVYPAAGKKTADGLPPNLWKIVDRGACLIPDRRLFDFPESLS